ncbi:hypothetical protein [Streptomyces sp. NPDC056982]|uniref:hypothetical protein n=1 Tax=Streptomyces sp. NPDC056982 TaxID=3345986 RepID=UPI003640C4D5
MLRIYFQLSSHEASGVVSRTCWASSETSPDPHDHNVDVAVTAALRHFGRSPDEFAQIFQLCALGLYGVHVIVGG